VYETSTMFIYLLKVSPELWPTPFTVNLVAVGAELTPDA